MTEDLLHASAIIRRTASHYSVRPVWMYMKSRREPETTARLVAMYLVSTVTDLRDSETAYLFGRNRTTVVSARRRVGELIEVGDGVAKDVKTIKAQL